MPMNSNNNIVFAITLMCSRGGSRIHKRGGAQIHCSEHDNCVRSTQSGMQSMPNLGGLGTCPPENFEKLDPLRLN